MTAYDPMVEDDEDRPDPEPEGSDDVVPTIVQIAFACLIGCLIFGAACLGFLGPASADEDPDT